MARTARNGLRRRGEMDDPGQEAADAALTLWGRIHSLIRPKVCPVTCMGLLRSPQRMNSPPQRSGLPIPYSPINSLIVSPTIRTAASMLGVGLEE